MTGAGAPGRVGSRFGVVGPHTPLGLRICRLLLWTQASLALLGGVFLLLTAALFGARSAIPFHGGDLSGGATAALGTAYISIGAALLRLTAQLARRPRPARVGILGLQGVLLVLLAFRSFEVSASVAFNLLLLAAISGLVLTPSPRAPRIH